MNEKFYLSEFVYAQFDQVVHGDMTLTTGNGGTIYLDPRMIDRLLQHLKEAAMCNWTVLKQEEQNNAK